MNQYSIDVSVRFSEYIRGILVPNTLSKDNN